MSFAQGFRCEIAEEVRELLVALGDGTLTFWELRRRATALGCDLRASVFRQLFYDAVEAGLIAETNGDQYRLTSSGANATGCVTSSSAVRTPSIQVRNPNLCTSQHRQGIQREIVFGESELPGVPICLERVTLQTGEECVPHSHVDTDTVVYTLSGRVRVYYGRNLESSIEVGPEDCVFIPAGVIHWVINEFPEPMIAVVARTSALNKVLEYPHLRPLGAVNDCFDAEGTPVVRGRLAVIA